MKTSMLALIATAVSGALADTWLACGHMLVNSGSWSQSDIAQAACGRSDTCDGKEWNTLFEVIRKSSGPSEWTEIETTGVFCHKGCWGDVGVYNGQCH